MNRLDLDRLLTRARPGDPTGLVLERAAVRVLARVASREGASLEGRAPPSLAALRRRVVAALAAIMLLAFALGGSAGGGSAGGGSAGGKFENGAFQGGGAGGSSIATLRTSCPDVVAAALRGEVGARRSLRQAGAVGRACVWSAIDAGQGEALRLLREGGRALPEADLERVCALALRPELARLAVEALAEEPARVACDRLGRLLVTQAGLEGLLVTALQRVAVRGGRFEAVEALLSGAAAGRTLAARAVVLLGPASSAERLLVLLPAAALESEDLVVALAAARSTFVARVLRRAEAGDQKALAWAVGARLAACVPLLHAQAVEPDEQIARAALAGLARIGTTEAWLALARSTAAAAGETAHELLAHLDATAALLLVARIESSARDRAAGLAALASGGPQGLAALARLGAKPAFAPAVIDSLTVSPCRGAAERLLELAQGHDTALPIVAALGRRLALGHADAGGALLALGRQGASRAAVKALEAAGERGERFLALAALDPALGEGPRPYAQRGVPGDRVPTTERVASAGARRAARPY